MDDQALSLLQTLKKSSVAIDTKLAAFNNLKSTIKHQRVPDTAQATIFECIKLGICAQTSPTLAATAFSTLGHLIKRLTLQEQDNVIAAYTSKLLPILQDRLGDARENLRNAASQILTELWPFAKDQVERVIREGALGGNNAKAKEAAMMWIVKLNNTEGLQFKGFVPSLVACLEDADGAVRETAKSCVVELFRSAPERAKNDLKKQMAAHDVRRTIMSFIVQHLGMENSIELDLGASTVPSTITHHGQNHHVPRNESVMSELRPQDGAFHDPLFVHSARELEDTFRDMLPPFEGRETEHNWLARDKNITKLRRILQGNAPKDYHSTFIAGIKSMLDSIIKFTNTLRTTPSTNACQLCQELYRTLGTAMDPMTEMMIQNFVKMSAATKNITAKQADVSMETVLSYCSYSSRVMQHIWMSFQEKNMQTRSFAPGWLKIIMKKGASHKSHIEHAGGLELIDKCLLKGLEDASPKVRESTRSAYWTYAQIWHNQAERFMENLDPKLRNALEKDPSNPNKNSLASSVSSITSTKSKAGTTVRPSVRDAIAAQRRAALQKGLPERPSSAQSAFPSVDAASARNPIRPAGAVKPTSGLSKPSDNQPSSSNRTITAGPVRRPKRPEINRPATADPYGPRNVVPIKVTTPTTSPHTSPPKNVPAARTTAASVIRAVPSNKTPARTPASSTPAIRAKPRAETVSRPSPRQQAHARINSMPVSPVPTVHSIGSVLPQQSLAEVDSVATSVPALIPATRPRGSDATVMSDADLDNFTMVIPDIRHDHADKTSLMRSIGSGSPHPHRSTLPRRTSVKAANENLKPGSPLVQRFDAPPMSQSPEKSKLGDIDSTDAGAVQVYEDPFQADERSFTLASPSKPVLEEIVINERTLDFARQSSTELNQSTGSNEQNNSGRGTPRGHTKTTSTGSILGVHSESTELQSNAEILKSKRLLTSAIDKVRAKSLDAHGFRRVQELIKTKQDIWGEDGQKFGDLLFALLSFLEAPTESLKIPGAPASSKVQNLKTQVLATIRGMLALHRKEAGPYYAHSLCAIISARRQFDDMSHIASEMEKTAQDISRVGPTSDCIDEVLDLLDSLAELTPSSTPSTPATSPVSPRSSSSQGYNASRTINLALQTLASLLASLAAKQQASSPAQTKRLGNLAVRLLQDTDPEIRRADMDFCLALHEQLQPDIFWKAVGSAQESGLNLITYYLARKGRA